MEIAGWGIQTHSYLEDQSKELLFVEIPVVPLRYCRESFENVQLTMGIGQLCAGGQQGYDSCKGNSGGPLMMAQNVEGQKKSYVLGLVSFGAIECGIDRPAVYTNVSYYMNWILDNVEL